MYSRSLFAFFPTKLKSIIITLVILFFFFNAPAQTLVNTTGATISNNSYSIEYAVGEIAITTLSSNDSYITQGLLQPIIKIGIEPCKMLDLIPTAFTPNNDGRNDCYGVKQWPFASRFEMSIFNRWGQLIYKTSDMYGCWDGKFNGKDQPVGVYVYMIRASTDCGPAFKKGTFALIR